MTVRRSCLIDHLQLVRGPRGPRFTWGGSLNFTAWLPSHSLTHSVDPTMFSHFPSASSALVRRRHATYRKTQSFLPCVIWPLPLSRTTSPLPSALLDFTPWRHSQELLPLQSPFLMTAAWRHVPFLWPPTVLVYGDTTPARFMSAVSYVCFPTRLKSEFMSCPSDSIIEIKVRALWHSQTLPLIRAFPSDIWETWRKDSLVKAWNPQVPAIGSLATSCRVAVKGSILDWFCHHSWLSESSATGANSPGIIHPCPTKK